MSLVSIIIPTFNSPELAVPCVQSILRDYDGTDFFEIFLVNNGDSKHQDYFPKHPMLTVIQQEKNVGWEDGLRAALPYCHSPYVVFMNDDTLVPVSSSGWLRQMLRHFIDPQCAAVGPSSNYVMAGQSIFAETPTVFKVKLLIGFCVMLRTSDLEMAGGVDNTLEGGDDLDLSIRLTDLGKYLICDKSVFIYHHGSKTGQKVHGSDWDSIRHQEATRFGIIRKHGLRKYLALFQGVPNDPDEEGRLISGMISKEDKVVDLGCGSRKTVPWAVGVDQLPKGTPVPNIFPPGSSVADVVSDVTQPLPFEPESKDVVIARHILEHVPDVAKTLANWATILRHGGHLVIAVPNDELGDTLHMDHDHKQAFTPETLTKTMESLGWKTKGLYDPKNKVSFVGIWEKNGTGGKIGL